LDYPDTDLDRSLGAPRQLSSTVRRLRADVQVPDAADAEQLGLRSVLGTDQSKRSLGPQRLRQAQIECDDARLVAAADDRLPRPLEAHATRGGYLTLTFDAQVDHSRVQLTGCRFTRIHARGVERAGRSLRPPANSRDPNQQDRQREQRSHEPNRRCRMGRHGVRR
jgi:hypothetical protein